MLGLDFFLCVYLDFVFYVFFHVSLGHFILVLRAFIVFSLVSSVLSQKTGWQESIRNVYRVGRETLTQSIIILYYAKKAAQNIKT